MFHLRIMIRQLLARAQIGQTKDGAGEKEGKPSAEDKAVTTEWEDTLLRLSLKLASRLNVACKSRLAHGNQRKY